MEAHLTYQAELHLDDEFVVTTEILAYDEKRIHQLAISTSKWLGPGLITSDDFIAVGTCVIQFGSHDEIFRRNADPFQPTDNGLFLSYAVTRKHEPNK